MERQELKYLIKADRYNLEDFWTVCPHSMMDIIGKKRDREFVVWRNVGMIWLWLSGTSMSFSAKQFNRDHATLLNSLRNLERAITSKGYADQLEVLNLVVDRAKNRVPYDIENTNLIVKSLINLENRLRWQ